MKKFHSKPLQVPPSVAGGSKTTNISVSGREKRRGVRLNSRVPIALEWDAGGRMQRGETKTRVVGPYGCLTVLPQDLQVDQRIQVVNLVSSKALPAVIVWRGHQGAEGWELGIELINPDMGFWGLDL